MPKTKKLKTVNIPEKLSKRLDLYVEACEKAGICTSKTLEATRAITFWLSEMEKDLLLKMEDK